VGWIRRFVRFHGMRHPVEMGEAEIEKYLTHLAEVGKVSASTQSQAASALIFLYKVVLGQRLGWVDGVVRARAPRRVPVVLTRSEVKAVFEHLKSSKLLVAMLLYGSGLRLLECLNLRAKDLDFERGEIRVRRGKGAKDRVTVLPASAKDPLSAHLAEVRERHERDRAALSPPSTRDRRATSGECRSAPGGHHEARHLPHIPALLRHTPSGGRLRHTDRPGASRSSGRAGDYDLYARAQPRRLGRSQPG
jgi:integrase